MARFDDSQVRVYLDRSRLVRSRDDSLSVPDVTSARRDIKDFGLYALKNGSFCMAVDLRWLLRLFHILAWNESCLAS